MSINAFMPQGNTYVMTANSAAATPVQILSDGNNTSQMYRISNAESGNTVWYAYGASSGQATANAVIPAAGSGNQTHAIPLPGGAVEVIRATPNAFFTVLTRAASANANVAITPGDGL